MSFDVATFDLRVSLKLGGGRDSSYCIFMRLKSPMLRSLLVFGSKVSLVIVGRVVTSSWGVTL
jgi:hypothetical protein